MKTPSPLPRKKLANGIVYISILLLGGVGGFALTSSLEPAEPQSDLKTYHFCLINSPTQITDFRLQLQAMEQGVLDKSTDPDCWTIFFNQQITSSAAEVPLMQMPYPRGSIFPPFYECDLKLTKVKGREASRFELLFAIGDTTQRPFSQSMTHVATTKHYLTLNENQTRIIQLDSGEMPDRKYLYAMVMAHPAPLPAVRNVNLNNKRLRRGKPMTLRIAP